MKLTHRPISADDQLQLFEELLAHLVDLASTDRDSERAAVDAAQLLCELAADLNQRAVTEDAATTDVHGDQPVGNQLVGDDTTNGEGVRRAIRDGVPAAAVAVVITKGDDRLLDVAGRVCRHFPSQADGRWIGFHPRDDQEALKFLRQAQEDGATHFVVPAFSLWWMQHYSALRAHLERRGTLVLASQHALVYGLPESTIGAVAQGAARDLASQQLEALVDAVLPTRCTVLVAAQDSLTSRFGDRRIISFPGGTPSTYECSTSADMFASLQRARRAGARYLVVAKDGPLSSRTFDDFRRSVRVAYPLIVDRPNTAIVFDLTSETSQRGAR